MPIELSEEELKDHDALDHLLDSYMAPRGRNCFDRAFRWFLSNHRAGRWNVVEQPDGSIKICKGEHERNAGCHYETYVKQKE